MSSRKVVNMWEKHVAGIISAIIVSLLLWIGNTTSNNSTSIARVEISQNHIIANQAELKTELDQKADKASLTDALRRFEDETERIWDRLIDIERDVNELGKKHSRRAE